MWDKLKQRWDVQSGWDVVIILLVFACTGFSTMFAKKALYSLLGLTPDSAAWLRWGLALLIILPLYQVLLLMWGWIFGKFSFFLKFEQRMLSRLTGMFKRSR
ncbi:DUF6787 family protein [Arundinibacter roseus]|uniref:Prolipoprotein diacylglyceryl transferase n=1 Tax=Arundinibacter roseus TaxID=2070510 RepID=A0A4R4JVH1_9BACT|nr:DUF6787 family protein [Arundinibacter roseus]TDB58092.1 prolipoprotein diacylglyceryl transferase [Arundinibacter roseus]